MSNRLVSMAGVHLDTGNTENIREVHKTTRRLVVEHTLLCLPLSLSPPWPPSLELHMERTWTYTAGTT